MKEIIKKIILWLGFAISLISIAGGIIMIKEGTFRIFTFLAFLFWMSIFYLTTTKLGLFKNYTSVFWHKINNKQ